MVMRNAQVRRYLREIQGCIPCHGKAKYEILRKIKGMIRAALSDAPEMSYEMLVERFGTPQQIAASYVDELDTPELLKKLRLRNKIIAIVCATAAIILAIWVGVVVTATQKHYGEMNGHIVEVITITEDNPDNGGE